MLKQLLISLVFLFLLFFIRNIPSYKNWYENRLLKGYDEIAEVHNITDVSIRRGRKYPAIKIYESIKKVVTDSSRTDSAQIVLIPSNDYIKAAKAQFSLAEPVVIYYFTGLRTVLPYTELSRKANWALIVKDGAGGVIPISSPAQLDSLITLYKRYPYNY